MKHTRIHLLALLLALAGCSRDWDKETPACTGTDSINAAHPKAAALQAIMDEYTHKGLPGISVAISSPEGDWAGSAGYAKLETQEAMLPCHLQYSQSVAKTYMAVAILQMAEDSLIQLDASITQYLPKATTDKVTGADKMTVRMLLNHTSGAAEYNMAPAYVTALLQHPLHSFTSQDYLDFIDGAPTQFDAGTSYSYTNTNYLLLALIGDEVTGDHAQYIREHILAPAGAFSSYYRESATYLDHPQLVNSYWDRYSNGTIENCTQMQQVNVASLVGDDGIIATPMDYVRFSKALHAGTLLDAASMKEMFTFVAKDSTEEGGYGLGIHKSPWKDQFEYGHTGGGIGAGCVMGYFPHNGTHFFVGINIGTIITSPLFQEEEAGPVVERLYDVFVE